MSASGRLLVCATPIGNLEDVTLRVLRALREADVVACEDTRRTGVLLERHGVRGARLMSLHEHNEGARSGELVDRIADGGDVALVTDAGTPLVSDPGFVLVRACVAAGLTVQALPGASSVLCALVASGLPVDAWRFVGFLPRRRADAPSLLDDPGTLVALESPRRLGASLRGMAACAPDRGAAVCRELTKLHEEIVRGSLGELAERYAGAAPRGEIVVVIGPAVAREPDLEVGLGALRRLVDAGARPRAAAGVVGELTGMGANALYRALLADSSR